MHITKSHSISKPVKQNKNITKHRVLVIFKICDRRSDACFIPLKTDPGVGIGILR